MKLYINCNNNNCLSVLAIINEFNIKDIEIYPINSNG